MSMNTPPALWCAEVPTLRGGEPSAPSALTPATLLVAGKGQVRTFALDRSVVRIGRAADCDVTIDDAALSREHARLCIGPPPTIQDLGSTNGTRVGGQTFRGGAATSFALDEGFQIGAFSFLIMRAAGAPSSTSRAPHEHTQVADPALSAVSGFVRDVAATGVSVLILGESGVGKEVLADTVHALSGRTGPLQRINCAALSEQLLESELFGHERGAFTGAAGARAGLLETAHGGTAFLDEIGELPLDVQAKLLRAIEAREIVRLGASRPTQIDVRFLFATNRELAAEVAARRFRADLFFRIDGITLRIPPLRDRPGMIAPLALEFAQAAGAAHGLTPEVLRALEAYAWPGNVRELKAVIHRASLLARGRAISPAHLVFTGLGTVGTAPPPAVVPAASITPTPPPPSDLTDDQQSDRARIVDALERCGGNQSRAAALLGISRTNLVTKLRVYRIPRPRAE